MVRHTPSTHHAFFGERYEPSGELVFPPRLSAEDERLAAFERILRRWEPMIHEVARRLYPDPAAAQSCSEETFLALFGSGVPLREPEHHLRDLIDRILARTAPDEVGECPAARSAVRALTRLLPGDREVIVLRFFADCSPERIAGMLAMHEDQVRLRLWNAMAAFERAGGRCGEN